MDFTSGGLAVIKNIRVREGVTCWWELLRSLFFKSERSAEQSL